MRSQTEARGRIRFSSPAKRQCCWFELPAAFEIPYSEISTTNLAGPKEVAIEFPLPANGNGPAINGHVNGPQNRGRIRTGCPYDNLQHSQQIPILYSPQPSILNMPPQGFLRNTLFKDVRTNLARKTGTAV